MDDLINKLKTHNIITYIDTASLHADKLTPLCHEFVREITGILSPDDYKGRPNEFIEMVIAAMTYTSGSLLIALFDMFPEVSLKVLVKNFRLSLDSSINLQMKNHPTYG